MSGAARFEVLGGPWDGEMRAEVYGISWDSGVLCGQVYESTAKHVYRLGLQVDRSGRGRELPSAWHYEGIEDLPKGV